VVLLIAFVPALRRSARARVPIRSLAVLPLANLTGDAAQEYFADGMTDALITNLASLPALRVISRQSVMRYKGSTKPLPEIARELGVEGVVQGSVVRSGGRVRISAQLVHAPSDRHLWAHSYERGLEDVLTLQGELSRAIAEEVRLTVGTKESQRFTPERTVKPEAYDAYLLGRHHWNLRTEQSLDKALSYFKTAIAADPDFALAHAGLALAYGPRLAYGYVPPGHGLVEQKTAALRALEMDPGLGEARAALGSVRTQEWDWQGAETEFRNAIEARAPTALWYTWYLHAVARADEALVHERRAMELDPLNITVNRALAQWLGATGQDEAALAQWNRALELEPDHAQSELQVALLHFEHGRIAEGTAYLARARSHAGDDPLTVAQLAVACAVSGNADEARHLLGRLQTQSASRYVSKVLPAYVHLALDERDRAFALLEEAYGARDPLLISIQMGTVGPFLYVTRKRAAALHSDPRFGDLLRRMGLVSRAPAAN
jgi:TolB-like protein/Tfp pilus assembly protein PilF